VERRAEILHAEGAVALAKHHLLRPEAYHRQLLRQLQIHDTWKFFPVSLDMSITVWLLNIRGIYCIFIKFCKIRFEFEAHQGPGFDPQPTREDNHRQITMGASVSWLSGFLFSKKEIRILILGLVRDSGPPLCPWFYLKADWFAF